MGTHRRGWGNSNEARDASIRRDLRSLTLFGSLASLTLAKCFVNARIERGSHLSKRAEEVKDGLGAARSRDARRQRTQPDACSRRWARQPRGPLYPRGQRSALWQQRLCEKLLLQELAACRLEGGLREPRQARAHRVGLGGVAERKRLPRRTRLEQRVQHDDHRLAQFGQLVDWAEAEVDTAIVAQFEDVRLKHVAD
eukprot:3469039-Pleurochrysis_carterae.AAC.1